MKLISVVLVLSGRYFNHSRSYKCTNR